MKKCSTNKIRKEKNATINKLLKENEKIRRKARQQGLNVNQLSKKELKKQSEQFKNYREAQIKESSKDHQLQKEMTKEEVLEYNKKIGKVSEFNCLIN
jgi:hypothetical protein